MCVCEREVCVCEREREREREASCVRCMLVCRGIACGCGHTPLEEKWCVAVAAVMPACMCACMTMFACTRLELRCVWHRFSIVCRRLHALHAGRCKRGARSTTRHYSSV